MVIGYVILKVMYIKLWFGILGNILRVSFFKILGANIGVGVIIRPGVLMRGINNISIGNNVFIGENCAFVSYGAKITIGDNTQIAPEVYLNTRNHKFSDITTPISSQGYKCGDILIHENSWLGFRSIILKGCTIGQHVVVGANEVVRKDIPDFSVYVKGKISKINLSHMRQAKRISAPK